MSLLRTAATLSLQRTVALRPMTGAIAIIRHSSTNTETAKHTSAGDKSTNNTIVTWNDYFKLRKKRRTFELVSCVLSTVASTKGSIAYFSQLEIDLTATFFGMDPLMAFALTTVSAGFCGYLAGPVLGNLLFKTFNSRVTNEMEVRDNMFYEHIKANRVDARFDSFSSPAPDYYGEKIYSVNDYRAWLRKQREHYRKTVFGG